MEELIRETDGLDDEHKKLAQRVANLFVEANYDLVRTCYEEDEFMCEAAERLFLEMHADEIKQKDETIELQKTQLVEKDNAIKEKDAQLSEKDKRIAKLEAMLRSITGKTALF